MVLRSTDEENSGKSSLFRAGNLLLDTVQTENGHLLMRIRPRGEDNDAFLFFAGDRQGFFKLQAFSYLSSFDRSSEENHGPVTVYIDKRVWLVHSWTGWLDACLPDTPQE